MGFSLMVFIHLNYAILFYITCISMKEQQNLWDLGLELALSVMLFLLCPKYHNLGTKLVILWNINIMRATSAA